MDTLKRYAISAMILLSAGTVVAENAAMKAKLQNQYQIVIGSTLSDHSDYYIVGNKINEQMGIVDEQGRIIFEPIYKWVINFIGYWYCTTDTGVEIYDNNRKLVHTVKGYERASYFNPEDRTVVVRHTYKDPQSGTLSAGKAGLIDLDGKVIFPLEYDDITDLNRPSASYYDPKPYVQLYKNKLYGIATHSGKIILPVEYSSISMSWKNPHDIEIGKGDFKGRASLDGRILVAPDKYTKVDSPSPKGYRNVAIGDKGGLIDADGKLVVPLEYTSVSTREIESGDTYITVWRDNKAGIYHLGEGELVPPVYDQVRVHSYDGRKDMIIVRNGAKVGVLTLEGKPLVPVEYDVVVPDKDGIRVVVSYTHPLKEPSVFANEFPEGCLWGYYDMTGKQIAAPEYSWLSESEGLLRVNRGGISKAAKFSPKEDVTGGSWGYLDRKGTEVVPIEYDNLSAFHDGVANGVKDGVATMIPHPTKGTKLRLANGGTSEFNSPVDKDIPQASAPDPELFAFIFATESYTNFEGADFALRDGETMKQYAEKALGAPASNVRMFADATYGNITSAIKKIAEIADVYDGDAKFLVYFAGLGATDTKTGTPYLLPADAVPSAISQTGIDLNKLMADLGQLNSKWTLALIDAPLNGNNRLGKPLSEGRGVRIAPKPVAPTGATFICTAATADGDAGVDNATGHGMLTLSFLENLQAAPAPTSIAERLDTVAKAVKRRTLESTGNVQAPDIKKNTHPSTENAKL